MSGSTFEQVETWWRQMPKPQPHYWTAVDALKPVLFNWPKKLVAIDGRHGVGKTTLGRFLSWSFNSTLVETDLYIVPPGFNYRVDELKTVIERRLAKNRPVIVEGVAILSILEDINCRPDFHIYVLALPTSDDEIRSFGIVESRLNEYEGLKYPVGIADLVLNVDRSCLG